MKLQDSSTITLWFELDESHRHNITIRLVHLVILTFKLSIYE